MKDLIQKKKTAIILLAIILLVASLLRLWQLGHVPISPDWDEVALGYDAYSLSQTGKDEFGKFLPVVLRSFDDYKPALYAYLIIPTYKIFGLNVFSVRLPSAIFGILTILAVYLLIKELFGRRDLALLTAFLLAISPWHIQFSRIAFESNVGLAFNIFAATFFLYGLKKPWLLTLSAIFAALSIYTYQSEKVFTPLFILGLLIIYIETLWKIPKKYLILALLAGLIVITPMVVDIVSDPQTLLRAKGTSIFNEKTAILKNNAERNTYNIETNNKLGKILDNRRLVYGKQILDGYFSHFNPNWLIGGDIARHHAPDMGLVYLWEFPFILIGIYILLFTPFDKKSKAFILFWFLLAPLPASVTTGVPHAVRTLNFLPTWQLFIALGLLSTMQFVLSKKYYISRVNVVKLAAICYLLFAIFNFIYYLNQYFVQQNYFFAYEWQYGYERMVAQVLKRQDAYDKVVFTDSYPLDKSYMFFLFYSQYSPSKYQSFRQQSGGFAQHQKFDKYEFRTIDWEKDKNEKKTLFIGNPTEFPGANILYTVNYPDGTKAIVMATK